MAAAVNIRYKNPGSLGQTLAACTGPPTVDETTTTEPEAIAGSGVKDVTAAAGRDELQWDVPENYIDVSCGQA